MRDKPRSRWIWLWIALLASLDVAEAVYLGWLKDQPPDGGSALTPSALHSAHDAAPRKTVHP